MSKNRTNEKAIQEVVKLMIKTLNQMGVTLTNVDVSKDVPTFYIELDGRRLLQSIDNTLKEAYGILWTIIYGKVTDENRNSTIDLQYKVINESEVLTDDNN